VYGRAIESLQARPASPERDALIHSYTTAALAEIRRAIEGPYDDGGYFDDLDLLLTDPDINSLRQAPEFDTIVELLRQRL
jgi:hypothetical protein